ncbi:hypothetical protein ACFL2J_07845 [Candidatus Omnitrophota bacterium]
MIFLGAGILLRKEICRKILIFTWAFSILTVYWKHPIPSFEGIINTMAIEGVIYDIFMARTELLVQCLLAYKYFITIGLGSFLIYFFTRPNVKLQFVKVAGIQ